MFVPFVRSECLSPPSNGSQQADEVQMSVVHVSGHPIGQLQNSRHQKASGKYMRFSNFVNTSRPSQWFHFFSSASAGLGQRIDIHVRQMQFRHCQQELILRALFESQHGIHVLIIILFRFHIS